MPYSHITRAAFRTQLRARLDDPNGVYWADAELNAILEEALRTFQAMTNFSRVRGTFNASANVAFYDLPSNLMTGVVYPLGYNVTDVDAVTAMSYHLLEPVPTGLGTGAAAWAGTAMFTLPLLVSALQRRRDAFLAATGSVLTQAMQNVPSAPIGRVSLADSVVAVRRAAWKDVSGAPYAPLWLDTAWGASAFSQGWSVNPGQPLSYSIIEDQPLELQLIPVPANVGRLDLVTVNSGATLDVTTGVLLGVPDNWVWAVGWGAVADLLAADGEAHDKNRADYAEARYQEGVEMCRASSVILQAQLQGLPVFVSSLADFDAFTPQWQEVSGPPTGLAAAGLNLVALGPVPDAGGPYSVTLDVVRNAPLPIADSDMIQVGREDLDCILALAQVNSLFKEGWASVNDSLPLYVSAQRHMNEYNQRILAQSRFLPSLAGQSKKEEAARPYREVTA